MRSVRALGPALLLLGVLAAGAAGQEPTQETEAEKQARMARRGAGLRVGAWAVADLPDATGDSRSPLFEGYFQRGLDRHLAFESSAGLWKRGSGGTSGGVLGGATGAVDSYVIPLMSGLKAYPFTRPERPFEPFVLGAVGFALGIEDSEHGGTGMLTGFGFKAGGGIEWRPGAAFGFSAGGRYQWIKFGDDVGGIDKFKGPAFEAGLTYRFQY